VGRGGCDCDLDGDGGCSLGIGSEGVIGLKRAALRLDAVGVVQNVVGLDCYRGPSGCKRCCCGGLGE